MKKRILTIFLSILILISVCPIQNTAFAAENRSAADVEIITDLIYNNDQETFYSRDLFVVREMNNLYSIKSPDNSITYFSGVEEFKRINEELVLIRFAGRQYAALYRGLTPLTNEIYEVSFRIHGDCLCLDGKYGPHFFDLKGNQRPLCKLPLNQMPVSVSAAGTVITEDINGYHSLFDKSGKIIMENIYTMTLLNDSVIYAWNEFKEYYDLNGNLLLRDTSTISEIIGGYYYFGKIIDGGSWDRPDVVSYEIRDSSMSYVGTLVGGICKKITDNCFIYHDENGRLGLASANGTILIPARFATLYGYFSRDDYVSNVDDLKKMVNAPKAERIAFREDDTWFVYDLNGNLQFQTPKGSSLVFLEDCIYIGNNTETNQYYNPYGELLFELPQDWYLRVYSGVRFMWNSNLETYILLDDSGTPIMEKSYESINSAGAYGIVNVRKDDRWIAINSEGKELFEQPFSQYKYLDFLRYPTNHFVEPVYTTYSIDGYQGICKYIPPERNCAESATGQHRWEQTAAVLEPTCTETGLMGYRCTACGEEKTESVPINQDNHAWSFTEVLDEADSLHACTGLYTCSRCGETKEAPLCAAEVFTDMPAEGNWAHDPIDWAYFNGITSGKSPTTFAPKDTVTRAEAMSFLWLTLGSPEPETTENPFADVKEGKYYYKPVLWAVENGITSGTSETTFGPKDPCTRAQILTFIWTAAGRPEPETTENPFTDVKEDKYYYKDVLWGVENEITSGIAPDQFGTNNTCTRAQIVAFLYKAKDLMHREPAPEPAPDPEPTEPHPDTEQP